MSTAKKPPATRRRPTKPAPSPPPCETCDGTGETGTAVRVGRRLQQIAATQTGLCPTCFGTGLA